MKTKLFGLLFMLVSLAHAVEISVGSTKLDIPVPSGFEPISSDVTLYATVAARFVSPSSEQFALFLPIDDVTAATKGEIPISNRLCCVQTSKELVQTFVSFGEFAELKRIVKTQNDEVQKKIESDISGFLKKVTSDLSSDYKVDFGVTMMQMIPLLPHYETERALAYSMIVKYDLVDANGKPTVLEVAGTLTFVFVRGKVLFLYVNAEKAGLEWSRVEAKRWADMVIAANPSIGIIAEREIAARSKHGIDWYRAISKGLTGAVIGGIVGLLGYWLRRKNG